MADNYRTLVEICISENKSVKLASTTVEMDPLIKKAREIVKRLQENNWKEE